MQTYLLFLDNDHYLFIKATHADHAVRAAEKLSQCKVQSWHLGPTPPISLYIIPANHVCE